MRCRPSQLLTLSSRTSLWKIIANCNIKILQTLMLLIGVYRSDQVCAIPLTFAFLNLLFRIRTIVVRLSGGGTNPNLGFTICGTSTTPSSLGKLDDIAALCRGGVRGLNGAFPSVSANRTGWLDS